MPSSEREVFLSGCEIDAATEGRNVGDGVCIGDRVDVGVGDEDGVGDGLGLIVAVAVGFGVGFGDGEGVSVGVGVGFGVSVGDGCSTVGSSDGSVSGGLLDSALDAGV